MALFISHQFPRLRNTISLADGANVGGRFLQQVQLGQVTTTGFLAVVFIRPPPHMYPPSWVMQVRRG
jgi:hypothetical protein